MKLVIVSDLHLGDPNCALLRINKKHGKPGGNEKNDYDIIIDPRFERFCDAVGTNNECLVLLGDIMDFAMRDYSAVYMLAECFFTEVKTRGLAKRIIYVPGNHDYDIWEAVEYQANIINRIKAGKSARNFKMSVPLLIDGRNGGFTESIDLRDVSRSDGREPYGGMFLDHLIKDNNPENSDYIPVIISFPNIYLVTEDEKLVLMTHGQFLEKFGSVSSELYRTAKNITGTLCMKDFISVNFPLSQLGSSGLGQAGPLSRLIAEIVDSAKRGQFGIIRTYLRRIIPGLLKNTWLRFIPFAVMIFTALANMIIRNGISRMRDSDYTGELVGGKDSGTTSRFNLYIESSMNEFRNFNVRGIDKNVPDIFLFGHTHVPVTGGVDYKGTGLLNAGGWLSIQGEPDARGKGVVFKYAGGKFTYQEIDLKS